jgi:hypothetical protein
MALRAVSCYNAAMQKANLKRTPRIVSKQLLRVFSSSWWQLDANQRSLVANHPEPLHNALAKLFDHDLQLRVVRSEEGTGVDVQRGQED